MTLGELLDMFVEELRRIRRMTTAFVTYIEGQLKSSEVWPRSRTRSNTIQLARAPQHDLQRTQNVATDIPTADASCSNVAPTTDTPENGKHLQEHRPDDSGDSLCPVSIGQNDRTPEVRSDERVGEESVPQSEERCESSRPSHVDTFTTDTVGEPSPEGVIVGIPTTNRARPETQIDANPNAGRQDLRTGPVNVAAVPVDNEPRNIPPEKRGGAPRGHLTVYNAIGSAQEQGLERGRWSVVCCQRGLQWIVGVQAPGTEEQGVHPTQGDCPLERDAQIPGLYLLRNFDDDIHISDGEGRTVPFHKNKGALLFKFLEGRLDRGLLVTHPATGHYAVVAPSAWQRCLEAGPLFHEPGHLRIQGYQLHFFELTETNAGNCIAFTANGDHILLSSSYIFTMQGNLLWFRDGSSPLYGPTPPAIEASDPQAWESVSLIVVIKENNYRPQPRRHFKPSRVRNPVMLPEDFLDSDLSQYSVRIYDHEDHLLDSQGFHFTRCFHRIQVTQPGFLPTPIHDMAVMVINHQMDCHVEPCDDLSRQAEAKRLETGTKISIPPHMYAESTSWRLKAPDGSSYDVKWSVNRLLWGQGTVSQKPSEWSSVALALSGEHFRATSATCLWIRFPEEGKVTRLCLGFQETHGRKIDLPTQRNRDIRVRLGDWTDEFGWGRLGTRTLCADIEYEGTQHKADLVSSSLSARCTTCAYPCSDLDEAWQHLEKTHLSDLFREVSLDELRERHPDWQLPVRIYKCAYCDRYVRSDNAQAPMTAIYQHQENRSECPHAERVHGLVVHRFEVVDDLPMIGEIVGRTLPHHKVCRKCEECLLDAGIGAMLRHLRNTHDNSLLHEWYTLE